jgi:hypothetical protein
VEGRKAIALLVPEDRRYLEDRALLRGRRDAALAALAGDVGETWVHLDVPGDGKPSSPSIGQAETASASSANPHWAGAKGLSHREVFVARSFALAPPPVASSLVWWVIPLIAGLASAAGYGADCVADNLRQPLER